MSKLDEHTATLRRSSGGLAGGEQVSVDLAREKAMLLEPVSGRRLL